jgi:hypothetical protein
LVLDRLQLHQHGYVVGTPLLAARISVAVAMTLAIDRDGYYVLRAAKLSIQAAGVDNADEEGEKPAPQDNRGQNLSLMYVEEGHVCNFLTAFTLPASRVGTLI